VAPSAYHMSNDSMLPVIKGAEIGTEAMVGVG